MAITHHLSNQEAIWNVRNKFQPNKSRNEDFRQKAHLHIRGCLLNGINPENQDSERLDILHKVASSSWLEVGDSPVRSIISIQKVPQVAHKTPIFFKNRGK